MSALSFAEERDNVFKLIAIDTVADSGTCHWRMMRISRRADG